MPSDANSSLRVLVVDDEQVNRDLVTIVLESLGVSQIDKATDGADALNRVQTATEPYGLIICDWDMPNMTGVEFLEAIRTDGKTMPFVMLTARTGTAEFNDAKRKGADYFLMKPLDVDGLQLRMGSIVSKAAAGA